MSQESGRWAEVTDGLPEGNAARAWELVDVLQNGPTQHPPDDRAGWIRWYLTYETPDGTFVRVSADRDPGSPVGFNPHFSSDQPE